MEDYLQWAPSVDAARIDVTARNGVVRLAGVLGSYAERRSAERTARRLPGVKLVVNDIEIWEANQAPEVQP